MSTLENPTFVYLKWGVRGCSLDGDANVMFSHGLDCIGKRKRSHKICKQVELLNQVYQLAFSTKTCIQEFDVVLPPEIDRYAPYNICISATFLRYILSDSNAPEKKRTL